MKTFNMKIAIEVRQDKAGINYKAEFCDIKFSEYANLLEPEQLEYKLKECLKAFKGFSMLTIDVLTSDGNYTKYDMFKSVRYTTELNEIKKARIDTDTLTYRNWSATDKKEIFADLKSLVKSANEEILRMSLTD